MENILAMHEDLTGVFPSLEVFKLGQFNIIAMTFDVFIDSATRTDPVT